MTFQQPDQIQTPSCIRTINLEHYSGSPSGLNSDHCLNRLPATPKTTKWESNVSSTLSRTISISPQYFNDSKECNEVFQLSCADGLTTLCLSSQGNCSPGNDQLTTFDGDSLHDSNPDESVFPKPAIPHHIRKRTLSLTAVPDYSAPYADHTNTRSTSDVTPLKFHTPLTGRVVKPIPGAFHSAGLFLKRNSGRREGTAMPETPLKKGQATHGIWNIGGASSINSTGSNISSRIMSMNSASSSQNDHQVVMAGFSPSPIAPIANYHRSPLHERVAKRNSTIVASPLSSSSFASPMFLNPITRRRSSTAFSSDQNDFRPHNLSDPFSALPSHNIDEAEDEFIPALRNGSDDVEEDAADLLVPKAFPMKPAILAQPFNNRTADYLVLYSPRVQFLRAEYFIDDWHQHIFEKVNNDTIQTNYFEDTFTIIGLLGSGQFAEAYKVQSRVDGQYYAIKKSKQAYNGFKDRQGKLFEVMMMWRVSTCSRCIRLFDAWEQSGYLYLQMELCESGNLMSYLEQNSKTGPLPDNYVWQIIMQVVLGLKELHDRGIVHLDLKPANIFINGDKILKIGDFGLASIVPVPQNMEREGDRTYMAPEVLSHTYSESADIFSLGLIALEAATNVILPENGLWWQRLRQGNVMKSFVSVNPPLSDVIDSMLAPHPNDRPTAGDLLSHPCISAVLVH